MKRENFIIRYRWVIILATIICVGLCVVPLTKIHINPDFESYLPDTMYSKQNDRLISEVFGKEEPVLIVMESSDVFNPTTLQRIEKLSKAFSRMSAFKRVYSLFQAKNITSEEGSMVVNPVIRQIPETSEETEELRSEIKSNDLAYKMVVSDDFHYALIMLSSNKTVQDKELIGMINQTLEKYPGTEKVMISGQPILRDEANRKISRDILVLLPIGLLLMFVLLWISFREIRGVLLPFSVVIFSITVCMALIPIFGWELSLIGVLVPIMMLAIANNYGVYFIARYQDLNASNPNLSMHEIVTRSFSYLFMPVLFCGLTTIVGILGLVAHLLIPARQMGVVTGIGICFALAASLLFVPAILSALKKGKPHKDLLGQHKGFFSTLLNHTGNGVTRHPKRVIISFAVFFAVCSSGLFFFKVAPDSNNVLPKKNQFNQAVAVTDQYFGGNKTISVMFDGDAKDPKLLEELDQYEQELKKLPNVGSVTSLATMVKKMSKALNDPTDAGYNQIPESRDAVAQYLELYSMNGDPEDLEQFVNFDYTKTLLTVQYKASKIVEINTVLNRLKELGKNNLLSQVIGGYSLVEKEMSESIVTGQNHSLIFAFIAILILIAIIFKSFKAGFIGSLPLAFAVFCTFGLMGWLGLELNMATALLSSISIGLGVDFTIQVFWRIKWELSNGNDYATSVKITLKTIGRGIMINAFAVMLGFSVLLLSAFPLVQSFGFLIILSLFLCLICALVLIPAICLVFKPAFLGKPAMISQNEETTLFLEEKDMPLHPESEKQDSVHSVIQ
ncbi:MAG TPA: MMPL family transporter [Prolixibacteraceae bacterium]|nr:MMPL family transporter [Prolixibacteraceae bacterium]HPS12684.1 MMPL family transporter [Prolixibacteraceae bacterium]